MMAQDCKRLLPRDCDRGSRNSTNFGKQVAATDYDQPPAKRIESLDGKLRPFVGDELAYEEVIILDFQSWNALEPIYSDRRMDNRRIAPVIFSDAGRDCLRIGDEMVDPQRRDGVPVAYVVAERRHQKPCQRVRAHAVVVEHIPDIAHRRVAIADVDRVSGGDYALGWSGFAADDEVIAPQIDLFEGERHEGEVMLITAPGK